MTPSAWKRVEEPKPTASGWTPVASPKTANASPHGEGYDEWGFKKQGAAEILSDFLSAPIRGLVNAPREVVEWFKRGGHNAGPSGGFLSDNPYADAYGHVIAAAGAPEAKEAAPGKALPAGDHYAPKSGTFTKAVKGAVSGAVESIPRAVETSIISQTGIPQVVRGAVEGVREALGKGKPKGAPPAGPPLVDAYEAPPAAVDPYAGRPAAPVATRQPAGPRQPATQAHMTLADLIDLGRQQASGDYYASRPAAAPALEPPAAVPASAPVAPPAPAEALPQAAAPPSGPSPISLAELLRDEMMASGTIQAPKAAPAPPPPAPAAPGVASLMQELPQQMRRPAADANYRAMQEGAPAAEAGPVYEAAARQTKAENLAKALHEGGITLDEAKLMDQSHWDTVSDAIGGHPASKHTQAAALFELRKLELAKRGVKNPAKAAEAERKLAEELKTSGSN